MDDLKKQTVALFLKTLKDINPLNAVLVDLCRIIKEESPGANLYASGGIIRDIAIHIIHNRPFLFDDLDLIMTGLNTEAVNRILDRLQRESPLLKKVFYVGMSFPVWKLKIKNYSELVDLALARTERSFGSHHRDFEFSTDNVSAEDDASRRDFAMNALYIEIFNNPAEELQARLHDFFGGLDSIVSKTIVCVGNPEDRFGEDPLRMLRAVRFRAKYAGFEIETATSRAIDRLVPELLHTISKERVVDELYKALAGDPEKAVESFKKFGVLKEILPEIESLDQPAQARICMRINHILSKWEKTPDPPLVFAAMLLEIAQKELDDKMRTALYRTKIAARFFTLSQTNRIARRLRLPQIKQISRLCNHVLLLVHADFLENAGAVIEEILGTDENGEYLLSLYGAFQDSTGQPPRDFKAIVESHPAPVIDFKHLLTNSGIPVGPHLYEIKMALRQAEIDGRIKTIEEAKNLLDTLYLKGTYIIQEHVTKVNRFTGSASDSSLLPSELTEEIRWLLFSRPLRLIRAYVDNDLLGRIFPELVEAEAVADSTPFHFSESFLNDASMALSLLYEEDPQPSPALILALLFLDIGKAKTKSQKADGTVTYYGHDKAGAEMAHRICKRLGVDESIAGDVFFIIKNHNALISSDGPRRIKRLINTVDESLIRDLLLVHKIDQTAKMKIECGKRIDEGQLDNFHYIQSHLEDWLKNAREKEARKPPKKEPLLSGKELTGDHPSWGPGLPEGPEVGRLIRLIDDLHDKGVVKDKNQAISEANGKIVLYHLLHDPVKYLEYIFDKKIIHNILPEIEALAGLSQDSLYHREDAYTHTIQVVQNLPENASKELILAAIFHDIGKAATQTYDEKENVFHFYGHEKESIRLFEEICLRMRWTHEDFNISKVTWLIESHVKIQANWQKMKNPKKTVKKLFFKGKGPERIPRDFRGDLIALRMADTSGATPVDKGITVDKIVDCLFVYELINEIEKEIARDIEADALFEKIKAVWNGRSVMKFFDASGKDIGAIVKLGQDYVRDKLSAGETDVTEEEVKSYVEKTYKKQPSDQ
jgi:tRNA nucleotidyltransferase/poly(A) polymerase